MTQSQQVTRRGALTLGAGISMAVLAACSSGDTSKKPQASSKAPDMGDIDKLPGPERLRAQTKFLGPTSYVKTYKVDSSGAGGAYRTVEDCYAAIATDKQQRLGVGAQSPQSNPWDWRKVEIAPGTYRETLSGTPPHVALIGMGAKPSDTHFITTGDEGTIGTTGRSTYVRNLFLEQADANPDSHPLREQGQSGDVGLGPLQRRTILFEDVVFLAGGDGAWGKTAADIMPGPGTTLVFRGCTFDAPGQQQQVNVVTNSHETNARSDFFFIGCTVAGNQKRAGNSDSTMSFPVGAPDFSAGHGDNFVWMDGHWNMGGAVRVDALLAFPSTLDPTNGKVTKKNPTTRYIVVNPGQVAGAKATAPDGVLPVGDQPAKDVSLPVGAVSAQEAQFFGERPTAKETALQPKSPQQGQVQVKAGDVYWVAVDLGAKAACAQAVTIGESSTGLAAAAITLTKDGKPDANGNAMTSGKGLAKGRVRVETHWYYPGQAPFWVGLSFDADASVPAMRADAGAAFRGGQRAGVTALDALTAVPAGTLVPRPTIVSAWAQG